MATRSYLSSWEYLVEPLEYELRQLGGVGFTIAAQTVMYHQRISSGHVIQRHEKMLLEELTKLRDPLQRAIEHVNQMMLELEPHSSKRRKATENPAGSQSSWNEYNAQESAGWVGIIYHNGLKNYEHYTPVAVEGIYRDWQKCCDVQARLAAMADEIGFFCRRGVESETYAIAKFQNWKAHAESLKRCDKLLNEPENYEIENFFDAINITEFGAVITQMQFEHNVILTAQLHNSNR